MEEHNTNYDPANRGSDTPPHPQHGTPHQYSQPQPNQQYGQPQPNQPYGRQPNQPFGQPVNQQYDRQPNQPYSRSPYQQTYRKSESPYKGAAIASLITGICAILFFWYIYLACFLAMAGIIAAAVYMSKRKDQRGLAIAGLITSITGAVLSIIFFFFIITFIGRIGSTYNQRYYDYYDGYYDYYDDYYDDDYYYDDYYDDDYYYDDYYNDNTL